MKIALNGWGQPYNGLDRFLPGFISVDYSRHLTIDALWGELKNFGEIDQLAGWSLGGQLAARAVTQGIARPRRLMLIAPPFQFVSSADCPDGMDPAIFKTFRQNYAGDPSRTAARFDALIAKNDTHEKTIIKSATHHTDGANAERWLPWLDKLAYTTMATENFSGFPDTLLIHGTRDAIVPFAQSEYYRKKILALRLEAWEGAGHAPHWHDASHFKQRAGSFFA